VALSARHRINRHGQQASRESQPQAAHGGVSPAPAVRPGSGPHLLGHELAWKRGVVFYCPDCAEREFCLDPHARVRPADNVEEAGEPSDRPEKLPQLAPAATRTAPCEHLVKRTRLAYVAGCEISPRRPASATPPGTATLRTKPGGRFPPFRRGNAYPQSPVGVLRPPGPIKLIPLRPLTCAAPGARPSRTAVTAASARGLAAQLPHRKTRARAVFDSPAATDRSVSRSRLVASKGAARKKESEWFAHSADLISARRDPQRR
jgi:hypothetical protein